MVAAARTLPTAPQCGQSRTRCRIAARRAERGPDSRVVQFRPVRQRRARVLVCGALYLTGSAPGEIFGEAV